MTNINRQIILIFILAASIRLFTCQFTSIVNLDGTFYINQAKAIYLGQSENVYECGLYYLSNYSLLILAAYYLFHDWIIAAKAVSLLFGFGSLIPLFLFVRRFFQIQISGLVLLVFALCPVLVFRSADVVRGPVYWFFLMWGLYFFIKYIEDKKFNYTFLSIFLFLIAVWARIEAIMFLFVSIFYIFVTQKKIKTYLVYGFAASIIICVCYIAHEKFDFELSKYIRFQDIISKTTEPLSRYNEVRSFLKDQAEHNHISLYKNFLEMVRHNVWLIALGTIFNNFIEALFPPFFLFMVIGFADIKKYIRDRRILYLLLISISSLFVLLFQLFQCWAMEHRYFAIIIFPCAIFIGFGIEKIIKYLQSKFKFKEYTAILIIFIFIFITGLGKNIKFREHDKYIFKKMGEMIAKYEDDKQSIQVIAGSCAVHVWVNFYANVYKNDHICTTKMVFFSLKVFDSYLQFLNELKSNNIKYIIWDNKNWKGKAFINNLDTKDFVLLMDCYHEDTGPLKLYKIKY